MLKVHFISKVTLIILAIGTIASAAVTIGEKKPILITSETLMVDHMANTATFEGAVVAKTGNIVIHSDKMTVFYDNSQSKIIKIHASGNVKVYRKERAIFSMEATYLGEEEKIVFTGEPRVIEGENIITGTQIIHFLKDDRSIIEGSKVILKDKQGMGK